MPSSPVFVALIFLQASMRIPTGGTGFALLIMVIVSNYSRFHSSKYFPWGWVVVVVWWQKSLISFNSRLLLMIAVVSRECVQIYWTPINSPLGVCHRRPRTKLIPSWLNGLSIYSLLSLKGWFSFWRMSVCLWGFRSRSWSAGKV